MSALPDGWQEMPDRPHWSSVPCELATNAVHRSGYVYVQRGRRWMGAHRWAFLDAYGWLPPEVCHHCDNRACIEILHLFPGTHAMNMADRNAKGRQGRMHGADNPSAKLTEEEVREIRRLYAAGGVTQRALARQFGVCQYTVRCIIVRKLWGHVDDQAAA